MFPLRPERVKVGFLIWNFVPIEAVIWSGGVRIPNGARGTDSVLNFAMPVTNHGAAVCAVHLQTEHVVAVHSSCPGRMNLHHNAALKLERDAGRVIAGAGVSRTVFVKPFWNLGAGQGGERPNRGRSGIARYSHVCP